jgi:hypothetical protein
MTPPRCGPTGVTSPGTATRAADGQEQHLRCAWLRGRFELFWKGLMFAFALLLISGKPFTFATGSVHMTTVHVEVDLYSGRPNPAWDLSAADAERFVERLSALTPMRPEPGGAPAFFEGLGYRGLKANLHSEGDFKQIVIADGIVGVQTIATAGRQLWKDSNRELEKWLLGTGKPYLDADLFTYLLHQVSGT